MTTLQEHGFYKLPEVVTALALDNLETLALVLGALKQDTNDSVDQHPAVGVARGEEHHVLLPFNHVDGYLCVSVASKYTVEGTPATRRSHQSYMYSL